MNNVQTETKKDWTMPRLTVYGTIERITQSRYCDKNTGGSDGFTFQGTPIQCAS